MLHALLDQSPDMFYACAARTGREKAVRDDLAALGVWAWLPVEIRHKRFQGCSEPQISERPRWPGYVFAHLTAEQFFEARSIKHLHATKLQLMPQEAQSLARAHDAISAENDRVRREIEAGQAPVVQYEPGDALEILDGPFADRLATFACIVRRSGEYRLSLAIDGMRLPVEVMPGHVRPA